MLHGLSLDISTEQCTTVLEWDQSGSGMDENFERLDDVLPSLHPR